MPLQTLSNFLIQFTLQIDVVHIQLFWTKNGLIQITWGETCPKLKVNICWTDIHLFWNFMWTFIVVIENIFGHAKYLNKTSLREILQETTFSITVLDYREPSQQLVLDYGEPSKQLVLDYR